MTAISSRSLLSACMDDIDKTEMTSSTTSSKSRSIERDSALNDHDHDKCQCRPTKEASKLHEVAEKNGYSELINALSKQEIEDMCDSNLPLRHFRGKTKTDERYDAYNIIQGYKSRINATKIYLKLGQLVEMSHLPPTICKTFKLFS